MGRPAGTEQTETGVAVEQTLFIYNVRERGVGGWWGGGGEGGPCSRHGNIPGQGEIGLGFFFLFFGTLESEAKICFWVIAVNLTRH